MSRPRAILSPDATVIVTHHADRRFRERCGSDDLDDIRRDVTEAIRAGRYEWRAKNIWYLWTADYDRTYSAAVYADKIVVMTVMTPLALAA